MNEPKRSSFEVIQTIAALLGAFTSILAGVAQFNKELNHVVSSMVELTPTTWWIMLSLLFFVSIGALWHVLIPRSRLLRPDALLLKTDKQEHLKGRIEDIERLTKLCLDFQQVNLVGESGAGKSALILAGLCPALKEKSSFLPLYMDIWGEDWEAGPEYTLTDILRKTLLIENSSDLWDKAPRDHGGLFTLLGNLRADTGKTPLIIFDQFDDYQARHRSKFIPSNRGTWISSTELVQLNSFWAGFNRLLSSRQIHCLFSTRNDAAEGLESIRFVTPQVYRLDRLKPNFIEPILTSLSTERDDQQKIIYAPNSGWERLKSRLARDLSQDGSVLPAQLKMALQGLGAIKSLTVMDYERAGGLDGIGAAYVEWHITNTARHCQLSKDGILKLLTSLVDNEQLKTTQKSQQTIFEAIKSTTSQTTVLSNKLFLEALESLSNRGLIRKRLDPDTGGYMWTLYHDYLCRGVLEAERRVNHWAIAAQEAYRTFQESGNNIVRRWQSLLSPWQQFMILCACIKGRFRYGGLRNFAFLSILRFLPSIALCIFAGLIWLQISQWQTDRAHLEETTNQFANVLDMVEDLLPEEILIKDLNAFVILAEKIEQTIANKPDNGQPIRFYKKAVELGSKRAAVDLSEIYLDRGNQELADFWLNQGKKIKVQEAKLIDSSRTEARLARLELQLEIAAANLAATREKNFKLQKLSSESQQQLDSGFDPKIEMLDPVIPLTRGIPIVVVRSSTREIIGKVTAASKLAFFTINDEQFKVNESGLFQAKITVPLSGKEMPVDIVAIDKSGNRSGFNFLMQLKTKTSDPKKVASVSVEMPGIDFGNYHALIIANKKYQKISSLETPVNDMTEISRLLTLKYGFKTTLLVNATRYDMLSVLNDFRSKLTEKDNLLIYYSGHGELDRVNMRGHWLPVDAELDNTANWISTIAITDMINAMSARHVMIVSDSVYSGAMTRSSVALINKTSKKRTEWLKLMIKTRSRTVLTSGGLKPVLDGGGDHSVFAESFIQVLTNNTGVLVGHELYRQISAIVNAKSTANDYLQVPTYGPIRYAGHESGEFLFRIPKGTERNNAENERKDGNNMVGNY